MSSFSTRQSMVLILLVLSGVAAGLLGGLTATWVLRATALVDSSTEHLIFWFIAMGGIYKGIAAATRRLLHHRSQS
jgi:hypothetical protein